MSSTSDKPRPPGRDGLPFIGETLAFARSPYLFIDERLAAHGRIFRTSVLGRRTAVLAGPEAAGLFIDPGVVMRDGSLPPHILALFGGRSLPLLDGDVHAARKRTVNRAFTRTQLAGYLPLIQRKVEQYFRAWAASGEIRWLDGMKQLAIEVICSNVIGMSAGDEMDRLRRDYEILSGGFAALPVNAPGTRYRKALRARDRIFETLTKWVREKQRTPGDDGLSLIVARPAGGTDPVLTHAEAALELHHIVIAGFIVFAELGDLVRHLTDHADVRTRLEADVRSIAPSGPVTPEMLAGMPYLLQVVNETKRLCQIVPAVFGVARREFEFDGVTVPAGWMVMWAVQPSHVAQSLYTDPTRFDPDRFSPERAEEKRHEYAFVPQGSGPVTGHRCPGLDYATCMMSIFAIVLCRGYSWQLPEQRFELNCSKTPPEPIDALRATVRAR
jgi:cytochrome P450